MLRWIREQVRGVRRVRRVARRRPPLTAAQLARVELLREQAKGYLPSRTAELAERFGFEYGRVTIRMARTRWGSCTGQNNLSLSLFLMTLPPHLIDYVIIHELCHTRHHNHSAAFHQEVNSCTNGCEKDLHRELRGYRIEV